MRPCSTFLYPEVKQFNSIVTPESGSSLSKQKQKEDRINPAYPTQ